MSLLFLMTSQLCNIYLKKSNKISTIFAIPECYRTLLGDRASPNKIQQNQNKRKKKIEKKTTNTTIQEIYGRQCGSAR